MRIQILSIIIIIIIIIIVVVVVITMLGWVCVSVELQPLSETLTP
jgi:hypothetical protein